MGDRGGLKPQAVTGYQRKLDGTDLWSRDALQAGKLNLCLCQQKTAA